MARAILGFFLMEWWRFVAITGGPGHPSHIHARWRLWQERQQVRRFLRGSK